MLVQNKSFDPQQQVVLAANRVEAGLKKEEVKQ